MEVVVAVVEEKWACVGVGVREGKQPELQKRRGMQQNPPKTSGKQAKRQKKKKKQRQGAKDQWTGANDEGKGKFAFLNKGIFDFYFFNREFFKLGLCENQEKAKRKREREREKESERERDTHTLTPSHTHSHKSNKEMASTLRKASDICKETREVLDAEEDVSKIQAIQQSTAEAYETWTKEQKSLQDQIRGEHKTK